MRPSASRVFWSMAPALAPRNGGLAGAVANTGGNAVGALAPVLTPLIGQAFGWDVAVIVACAICGLGALLWLGVRPVETTAKDASQPAM